MHGHPYMFVNAFLTVAIIADRSMRGTGYKAAHLKICSYAHVNLIYFQFFPALCRKDGLVVHVFRQRRYGARVQAAHRT
jgi:hypothetical protein